MNPRIGVVLPNTHPSLAHADTLLDAARVADRNGFDGVWLNDHIAMPLVTTEADPVRARYSKSEILDPLAMLAALAVATERVRLGVSVLVLPYRHPVLVAKLLATADQCSHGRIVLGVGAGWMAEQFAVVGVPYADRGRRTDEYIAVLHAIWASETPSFAGEFVTLENMRVSPLPVQPGGPPLWVGGRTRRSAQRAAAIGAPWHPSHWGADEVARNHRWLVDAAEQRGVTPPDLTLRLRWDSNGDGTTPDGALGTAPTAIAQIEELATLGVTDIVVEIPAGSGAELCDGIEKFAAEVVTPLGRG